MAVADDVSTDQLKQGEYIVATTEDPAENPAKNFVPPAAVNQAKGPDAAMKAEKKLENILKDVGQGRDLNDITTLQALSDLEVQVVRDEDVDILINGLRGHYGMNRFFLGRASLPFILLHILSFDPQYLSKANTIKIIKALKDFYGLNGPEHADPQLQELLHEGRFDYRDIIVDFEKAILKKYSSIFDGEPKRLANGGNFPFQ